MAKRESSSVSGEITDRVLHSLNLLDQRHAEIKELSTALSERIERFEEWVATLSGRTQTSIPIPDPDGDQDYELWVSVDRSGKRWVVSYQFVHCGDPDTGSPTPLTAAGVKIKAHVLPHLPRLIENMVESQELLAARIREANERFDAFAARVKIPSKEGK